MAADDGIITATAPGEGIQLDIVGFRAVHVQHRAVSLHKVEVTVSIHAGLVAQLLGMLQHVLDAVVMGPAFELGALERVGICRIFQPLEDIRTGAVVDTGSHKGGCDAPGLYQFITQPVGVHHVTVDDGGRGGVFCPDGVVTGIGQIRGGDDATADKCCRQAVFGIDQIAIAFDKIVFAPFTGCPLPFILRPPKPVMVYNYLVLIRVFLDGLPGAARIVDKVQNGLCLFVQRLVAYADGVDLHAASGVLKILSRFKRCLNRRLIAVIAFSANCWIPPPVRTIIIIRRLAVGNEEGQVFAAVTGNTALSGNIAEPLRGLFHGGFVVGALAVAPAVHVLLPCTQLVGELVVHLLLFRIRGIAVDGPCTGSQHVGTEAHELQRNVAVMVLKRSFKEVLQGVHGHFDTGGIGIRMQGIRHRTRQVEHDGDVVVLAGLYGGLHFHAAAVACGHGAGNALTAGDGDGVVTVVDGGIRSRRLVHHFQRHMDRSAGNVAVGVFGLEDQLELVGFLSITGNTELFVLFHGPVAVLVQRGGEELLAVNRLTVFARLLQRTGQDGFAGRTFAEFQLYRLLVSIHQNRDGSGGTVLTERVFIHHAGKVELNMTVRIGVGKTVRTGRSRHRAFADDEGVVALGDEIDALDGEVAMLVPVLVSSVVYGGDDHLVETAQHDI